MDYLLPGLNRRACKNLRLFNADGTYSLKLRLKLETGCSCQNGMKQFWDDFGWHDSISTWLSTHMVFSLSCNWYSPFLQFHNDQNALDLGKLKSVLGDSWFQCETSLVVSNQSKKDAPNKGSNNPLCLTERTTFCRLLCVLKHTISLQ